MRHNKHDVVVVGEDKTLGWAPPRPTTPDIGGNQRHARGKPAGRGGAAVENRPCAGESTGDSSTLAADLSPGAPPLYRAAPTDCISSITLAVRASPRHAHLAVNALRPSRTELSVAKGRSGGRENHYVTQSPGHDVGSCGDGNSKSFESRYASSRHS